MNLPRIIGLSGKIGSGKTTIANLLLEKFNEYERIAFGDILKREASKTYNFPLEWVYSEEGKNEIININPCEQKSLYDILKNAFFPPKNILGQLPRSNMNVREILQWHGTEFRRAQDPNYWVSQMRIFIKNNPWVIIDDVRFENEADLVKELGGVVIRINPHDKWLSGDFSGHRSETSLDNYDQFDLKVTQLIDNPNHATDLITNYINNLS